MKKIIISFILLMALLLGSTSVFADPWPNPVTQSVTIPGPFSTTGSTSGQ